MNPQQRLLHLLLALASARGGLSRPQIAERLAGFYLPEGVRRADGLGVKAQAALRKMLQRDLEALERWGYTVACERDESAEAGGEYRYRLELPRAWLSDELVLELDEAEALGQALGDPALAGQWTAPERAALDRLKALYGPQDAATAQEPVYGPQERAFAALEACRDRGAACRVLYQSAGGEGQERVLTPLGAFMHKGAAYVVAMCHRIAAPKTFRMDRMLKAQACAEPPLAAPTGFDLRAYVEAHVMPPGAGDARVRVPAPAAAHVAARYPWAVEQRLSGGGLVARFKVFDPARFRRFVLALGPGVVILEPESLRQDLAAMAREALDA